MEVSSSTFAIASNLDSRRRHTRRRQQGTQAPNICTERCNETLQRTFQQQATLSNSLPGLLVKPSLEATTGQAH